MALRFVFKCIFLADGNFKADHVWQKHANTDIWLWDEQFLQAAIEQLTIGMLHLVVADADATPNGSPDLYPGFQKAPCENKF